MYTLTFNRYVHTAFLYLCVLLTCGLPGTLLAQDMIIDDRSSASMLSALGTEWRLVTDTVMGGRSSGSIALDNHNGRDCLRMRGNVSTENNGGFVQMSLPLSERGVFDATDYDGIELEVSGNEESYNLHFRTAGLWFPWQSYRATFNASAGWQTVRIPFTTLEAYKTSQKFPQHELKRVGLLGIGRNFQADLCLASIRFYSD